MSAVSNVGWRGYEATRIVRWRGELSCWLFYACLTSLYAFWSEVSKSPYAGAAVCGAVVELVMSAVILCVQPLQQTSDQAPVQNQHCQRVGVTCLHRGCGPDMRSDMGDLPACHMHGCTNTLLHALQQPFRAPDA